MVFCNMLSEALIVTVDDVTILILVDGFLQYEDVADLCKIIGWSQSLF